MSVKISLCITTMNRFDIFLNTFLDKYLGFLVDGTLDEIVICDETGEDYDKICATYGKWTQGDAPQLRVVKNEKILGVFLNKLKVCSLARNRHIALIDSDNFTNKKYFQEAKKYILDNLLVDKKYFVVYPSFATPLLHKGSTAKPCLDFRGYSSMAPFTRETVKLVFAKYPMFQVFLNGGNFILTKDVVENITVDENTTPYISSCDVIYFMLLSFQELTGFELHIAHNLEYLHSIHGDSEYLKKNHIGTPVLNEKIIPAFYLL